MKKIRYHKLKLVLLLETMCLISCAYDWHSGIALIKNNTASRILISKQPNQAMTDSILFNERFDEYWIDIGESQKLSLPNTVLSSKPDSEKAYLYVFNCDSVDKYQALKKIKGIVQSAFIRKIEIQLNKVKEPLDTIYIK